VAKHNALTNTSSNMFASLYQIITEYCPDVKAQHFSSRASTLFVFAETIDAGFHKFGWV